ncbi:MAG: hypothetical protein Q8Q85_11070 [Gemmatimonadales bacterium]|nr:hypothetical protein [Gemmatimonadales bacterium]
MKLGGSEIVVRALEDEGIPFTFGIPGTHRRGFSRWDHDGRRPA